MSQNDDTISRQATIDVLEEHEFAECCPKDDVTTIQPERNNREFIKLAVRDSNGRPYYSIIYLEIDKNGIGHDFEGYSSYSLDVISDYLKKYFMPSAQPGWIPCSERLPEDDDYKPFSYYEDGAVLFCTKDGKVGFGWYYESTREWANEDDKTINDVIAWMPRPEPYKKNKK